jgi:hypothetical protein
MPGPSSEQKPLTRGERWTYVLILLAVFGLFGLDIAVGFEPAKLSVLFILLFWIALLVTHEAGHAIAARLLGWHVGRIVLGFGRTWVRIRSYSAEIEIRSFPVTGFVLCVPTHLRQPRLRNALIYFAGPGTDLLIAALVIAIVGYDRILTPSADLGMIALQSLAVASLAQGVLNLIPFPSVSDGEFIVNDGLGIIRSFTLPDSYFAQQIEGFREHGLEIFEEKPKNDQPDSTEWWKKDRRL